MPDARAWPRGMRPGLDARMATVPALGEYTTALQTPLGFAPREIEQLRADAAIRMRLSSTRDSSVR